MRARFRIPPHAAKKTSYEEKEIPPAQLAWLFRVRQIAKSIAAPKYSEQRLLAAVPRLRELLVAPEEARSAPRILAQCGVRFVVVETLPQAKIDGVCFWAAEFSRNWAFNAVRQDRQFLVRTAPRNRARSERSWSEAQKA